METVTPILRDLWQRRRLVALFGLVAFLLAMLVAFRPGLPPKSRAYRVGEGHLQILVDTPASQVVDVASADPAALGGRAGLLATLMVGGDVKQTIAAAAKLRPQQLIAVSSSSTAPTTTSASAVSNPLAYVLKTSVVSTDVGDQLPIIEIDTQAPDARSAAALANAAATGLTQYLDARANREGVPQRKRLQVRSVGVAQARDVVKGSGKLIAAGVAVVVFGLLCGSMLLLIAVKRSWRALDDHDEYRAHRHFADPHDHASDLRHPAPVVPIAHPAANVPQPPSQPRGGWAAAPDASVAASRR